MTNQENGKERVEVISFRVSAKDFDTIWLTADDAHVSLSEFIRQAVNLRLKEAGSTHAIETKNTRSRRSRRPVL